MRELMAVTKAMADENRVRILMALQNGELCACQIQAVLDLAPSTVSKHLAILYQARLVEYRKQGRWVYYRLPRPEPDWAFVADILEWLRKSLRNNPKIQADCKNLARIRCLPREQLCND